MPACKLGLSATPINWKLQIMTGLPYGLITGWAAIGDPGHGHFAQECVDGVLISHSASLPSGWVKWVSLIIARQ